MRYLTTLIITLLMTLSVSVAKSVPPTVKALSEKAGEHLSLDEKELIKFRSYKEKYQRYEVPDVLHLDVTPLSLCIETADGRCVKLIKRHTTIPTEKSQTFSTAEDNQTAVSVHVLQGEREVASGNKSLGRFDLEDIPPASRGTQQIKVTFDIDANGIMNISAEDKATGNKTFITIKEHNELSEEEVKAKVRDAEEHKEGDQAVYAAADQAQSSKKKEGEVDADLDLVVDAYFEETRDVFPSTDYPTLPKP